MVNTRSQGKNNNTTDEPTELASTSVTTIRTVDEAPHDKLPEKVATADFSTKSTCRRRTSMSSGSRHSATSLLVAEAQTRRRRADRAREIARLLAEEAEDAEMAALQSKKGSTISIASSSTARTKAWVQQVRDNLSPPPSPVKEHAPVPYATDTSVLEERHPHPVCPSPTAVHPPASSDIAQLAQAIATLAGQSKSLPKLPVFSGNIKEWMAFKSSYDRSKTHFSNLDNLTRLTEALRGEAREAVDSLLYCGDSAEEVVRALEQTYARPELLVAQEVAALRATPKISTPEQLNTFTNKVRNCVTRIKLLKQHEYLYSPELYRSVLTKLSEITKARYSDYAASAATVDAHIPKLEILSKFLVLEADKQLKYTFVPDFIHNPSVSKSQQNVKRDYIHATTDTKLKCVFCNDRHLVAKCKEFINLSNSDKWEQIKKFKLCYRCLKGNRHTWNACNAKPCGIDGCTRRHHALLHRSSLPQPVNTLNATATVTEATTLDQHHPINKIVTNVTGSTADSCNITGSTQNERVLLKVLPITISGPRAEIDTFALLDDGSTATLIDADVAAQLGLECSNPTTVSITGVGGMARQTDVSYVDFFIRGQNTTQHKVENAKAIKSLDLCSQTASTTDIAPFSHLRDLSDELCYNGANPTVLLGACDWHLTLPDEIRRGKRGEPVAAHTPLGWVIYGTLAKTSTNNLLVNCIQTYKDSLETLVKEQFNLDVIGISNCTKQQYNHDEQRAIDILEVTAKRLESGHFQVGLPWRTDMSNFLIPDSYYQALSRLKSLERQMIKNPEFALAYNNFMDGVLSKNYAEECSESSYFKKSASRPCGPNVRWYLPTFGVFHPQKKKLRVVHDAAATNDGVSLNSLLLTGPDLLQSLLAILFRFREGKVALTGDIREMFPQIKIRPEDRDAQRFLWRNGDTNAPIKEYRMSSMIFGAASSPCTAIYIKNKNALEFKEQYPEAVNEIIENHYMDDYISSMDDVQKAASIARDVVTVHAKGGFEMRAWTSNNIEALSLIRKELWANSDAEVDLPNQDISALGIKWNPCNDSLGFRTGKHDVLSPGQATKRKILSHVMSIYDPLGLLSPVLIKGRIIIQRLWKEKLGWDDAIPGELQKVWNEWLTELESIMNLRIPRWYLDRVNPEDTELHMFADASEQAYVCVAYWRHIYSDNSVKISIIASKARVAPLKLATIPRLELQAALIATRLARTIRENHRYEPSSTFFWTDSMIVLNWIRSDVKRFKPFVAHRINEICENSNISDWHYIPTALNVADDATRLKPMVLDDSHRWFMGPSFLLLNREHWPQEHFHPLQEATPLLELKTAALEVVGVLTQNDSLILPVPDASRFSVWTRYVRATARLIIAVKLFRNLIRNQSQNSNISTTNNPSSPALTATECKQAEQLLFRRSQWDSFKDEIMNVRANKPLPKQSRLKNLSVTLDEDGLLRLDSRTKRMTGSNVAPLVLDGRHRAVRLFVQHHHIKAAHGFNELVLNEIRQNFWILRCRSLIKSISRDCHTCRRLKARPQIPPVGDLPPERLQHHTRPFTNTGLDYFGPLDVTIGRRHEKRWVALFTCLVTRALHLETVSSLSSDSAIMCLRRFIARRGCPNKIFSDNGTAFVGANRELKILFENSVQDFAANNRIEWIFIPPSAPFMGGVWERMVRTVKTALKAVLKDRSPREEVLQTLLLEVESIVNARPLTYVSVSPDDVEAVTPFHYILGTSSTSAPYINLSDDDLIRRSHWKRAARLADHFWTRWVKEYLPLISRRRPVTPSHNFKEGDIVAIADAAFPRGTWPTGRIIRTYKGADGTVRVVDLRTKAGVLKRATRKLIFINV